MVLGGVYMIPLRVSFRYEIQFRTAFTWESFYRNDTDEVSCEPSFLQAILKRCCLSTRMRYPSQSTRPLSISYRDETSYLLYMIPVQNVVRFHTGTSVSYWYENRSELVPVQHFVPVSCKRIQSYKWAPG